MKQQRFLNKKTYLWSGINLEGKQLSGEIDAISQNFAKAQLQQLGICASRIHKKGFTLPLWQPTISSVHITVFYRQLATMIKAGIPIAQSLQILSEHQEHAVLRSIIQSLKNTVESGQTLSKGLRKQARYFDALTCHLIYIAEESGTLDFMLTRISDYKEEILKLKNKIRQALFYPVMIMLVAVIVSLTMLLFVVPRFADIFANFHAELPVFTLAVVHFSHLLRAYYWLGFIPIFLFYIGYVHYQKSPRFKLVIHQQLLKIPMTGGLLKKFILARFARTLATLFFAGIPVIEALKLTTHITDNEIVKAAITALQLDIAAGLYLHQAMQKNPLYPAMMTHMIKVGEESGFLESMLEKIAELYESEIDYWLKNFSNILEPLIIIILGVLIGGLVIAMYLPIFKLGTVI